jgi:hypothetical protein
MSAGLASNQEVIQASSAGPDRKSFPSGLKPGVIFVDFDVRAEARTLQPAARIF